MISEFVDLEGARANRERVALDRLPKVKVAKPVPAVVVETPRPRYSRRGSYNIRARNRVKELVELRQQGLSFQQISDQTKIAKSTVRAILIRDKKNNGV